MKGIITALSVILSLAIQQGQDSMSDQQAAFEGAEGYGAFTSGGRGGRVVHVTNLDDSGIGSLRWALDQSGPRTIVFDVSGTITLSSQIVIEDGDVTIAGQTAPGDGISIAGSRIRVNDDNVVVRGLHFRPGDGEVGMDPDDRDGLMIGTTDHTISDVIIDHNSFEWAVDENLTINGNVSQVTISNNIIAEGLNNSIHSKGAHSKGLLVSNWGQDDGSLTHDISIIKNLMSGNAQRNPEVRAGQNIEIINNLSYNYGLSHVVYYLGGASGGTLKTDIVVVGNVITPGPSSQDYKVPIAIGAMADGSIIVLDDNLWTKIAADSAGNQDQRKLYWDGGGAEFVVVGEAVTSGLVNILDSLDVTDYVLANAGANPNNHDAIDQRIIDDARNGTGSLVDSLDEVGGPAPLEGITGPSDSDRDGMPDWFETLYGFDLKGFDANGDSDGDGYTNLEEYINGLITGFDTPVVREPVASTPQKSNGTIIHTVVSLDTPIALEQFLGGTGEKIDLSAVLRNYDPSQDDLSDFIEIAYVNGDSYITVDSDGLGGSLGFTTVAVAYDAYVSLDDIKIDLSKVQYGAANPDETVIGGNIVAFEAINIAEKYGLELPDLPSGDGSELVGSAENDTFKIAHSTQYITEALNGGMDLAVALVDFKLSDNVENLSMKGGDGSIGIGNALDNKIAGSSGDNIIFGRDGDDQISGQDGDDRMHGGEGDDRLQGGDGNDVLYGGKGADSLKGGDGNDIFAFGMGDANYTVHGAQDVIQDLEAGDTIILPDGTELSPADIVMVTTENGSFENAISRAEASAASYGVGQVVVSTPLASYLFWNTDDDRYSLEQAIELKGITAEDAVKLFKTDAPFADQSSELVTGGTPPEDAAGKPPVIDPPAQEPEAPVDEGTDTPAPPPSEPEDKPQQPKPQQPQQPDTGAEFSYDAKDFAGEVAQYEVAEATGANVVVGAKDMNVFTVRDTDTKIAVGANGGSDLVVSFADYRLSDNVEKLSLKGSGAVNGTGNALDNMLVGNELGNALVGLDGTDMLRGMAGDDKLFGGNGNDRLEGNDGEDLLQGGAGADYLFGGAGHDSFRFDLGDSNIGSKGVEDQIMDFGAGDCLVLPDGSVVDPLTIGCTVTTSNNFASILEQAHTAADGSGVAMVVSGDHSWVFWNTDDDPTTLEQGVMLRSFGADDFALLS